MPKISPERLEARQRGIVQAAARCLGRNGLDATGMRDLFRSANLSPGAVYRYFASKEDLLAAVASTSPGLVEAALAAVPQTGTPKRRLRLMLEACAAGTPAARLQIELETAALRSRPIAEAMERRRATARSAIAEALAVSGGPGDGTVGLAIALCEALARQRLLEPQADLGPAAAAAERALAAVLGWADEAGGLLPS